jgi:hypothetical protein
MNKDWEGEDFTKIWITPKDLDDCFAFIDSKDNIPNDVVEMAHPEHIRQYQNMYGVEKIPNKGIKPLQFRRRKTRKGNFWKLITQVQIVNKY